MTSVSRDKKKYGAPTVFSKETREKLAKREREEEATYYINNDPRRTADNGYHHGKMRPLIEDE